MKSAATTSRRFRLLFPGILTVAIMACSLSVQAQVEPHVIQISGKVVTEENGKITFVPYAAIGVRGTGRGTFSDYSGFYSLPVINGETLVFSVLGYKDAYFTVPDTMTRDRYTVFQILTKDTILLPAAVVYPWPDPDNFEQEFLAMDVTDDLEDIAEENLSDKAMAELREYLPSDGPEHQALYLKRQASNYYTEGQFRTSNLFNAAAWMEFIQAWRRGDFKKKKK